MAERAIRLFGDPVLKTVSAPVTTFDAKLDGLIDDLLDSVQLPGRAGVAAPQIGVNLRVFSYNVEGALGYVVNPEIVELGDAVRAFPEGCLSVPGLGFETMRHDRAVVRGVDRRNEPIVVAGEAVLAQALQHETDHLDGILYLDRLDKDARRRALREVRAADWF